MQIRMNDEYLCENHVNDKIPESVYLALGCSAVVHANVGDEVFVHLEDGYINREDGTFVGYLIARDLEGVSDKSSK